MSIVGFFRIWRKRFDFQVIHGCGDLLISCFPEDQIADAKFEQLDLLRKGVLEITKHSYNQV